MDNNQLRSQRSTERVHARFVNISNRTVEIVWINFTGQQVRYKLLHPGKAVDVNTYTSHPWVALDVHTKDRMHLNKQFVYMPKSYEYYKQRDPTLRHPVVPEEARIMVLATLPMRSLKLIALLNVRDLLKVEENVDGLDLPKNILGDLKTAISLRNECVTTPIMTVI